MDRLLLAVASLALVPAALAQTRIPPELVPQPPPTPTSPTTVPPTAPAGAKPTGKVLPRGATLEEVSGSVRDVDRKEHRLTLDTPKGAVTLSVDRNTMVYTPAGLGTVLDIVPGAQIRAGRNADLLAYWVQVRAAAAPTTSPAS